jgi:hypothetical protein
MLQLTQQRATIRDPVTASVAGRYFHSQYSERVFPAASITYSNSAATLLGRDCRGGMLWK